MELHNVTNFNFYQLLFATNLVQSNWNPGEVDFIANDTNTLFFNAFPMTNTQTFFRGQQASTVMAVYTQGEAYETNPILGIPGMAGAVAVEDNVALNEPLTVYYTLSGTARNGIDYTNLSGAVTIPSNSLFAGVYVQPIDPSTLTNPIETVVFTVEPNTNYLVDPNHNSAIVYINSSSTKVLISDGGDAIRPIAPGQPKQDGVFSLSASDDLGYPLQQPLNVLYQITGTASNGVDYQQLSGSIILPTSGSTNITIVPLAESQLQGTKYVTLTLIGTNGYEPDPTGPSATNFIFEQVNTVGVSGAGPNNPAINPNGPPGAPAQTNWFTLNRSDTTGFLSELTINYEMGGQTSNGVDYSNIGTVTFPQGQSSTTVVIDPINNWTNVSKTVVFTLSPGYYVIDTNNAAATNIIDNSTTTVAVDFSGTNAIEPGPTNASQAGIFNVSRSDSRTPALFPALQVYYSLNGSATNGVDYTNLSGVISFAAGQTETNIYIQPLTNSSFPGDKSVIISLVPGDLYDVDTNNPSATLVILDNNIQFQTVTDNLSAPTGMDYDPFLTNLIFSEDGGGFQGFDFWRLGTNITQTGTNTVTNLTLANWSTINGLTGEAYLTVVTNDSSGFTNGVMLFGGGTGVGLLSSNAATSNLNWSVLTNATETNSLVAGSAICMDTTGAFSNNLITITTNDLVGDMGVWEVDSHGNPTLLARIPASLAEGAAVVRTNFGPWSQEIIAGDEGSTFLYTIATNGVVTTNDSAILFPRGIHTESIEIIPPNQSLYLCDSASNLIAKLPKSYFTSYVGDLLIGGGGEDDVPGGLFIVHWDPGSTNFITRRIEYNYGSSSLERCLFAPIELPAH